MKMDRKGLKKKSCKILAGTYSGERNDGRFENFLLLFRKFYIEGEVVVNKIVAEVLKKFS